MNPNATYALASAELIDGKLRFDSSDGFARAIADGFFFVKSPSLDLAAGDTFARNFYLPRREGLGAPYQGFAVDRRSAGAPGRIFLPRRRPGRAVLPREPILADSVPRPLLRQAERMRSFSLEVPGRTRGTGPAGRAVDEATGRCLSMQGTYHLTFNHFRSHVRAAG